MKKIAFLLTMILALSLSSCGDEYYTENVIDAQTSYYKVKNSQWQLIENDELMGTFWFYTVNVPALNKSVYDYGMINAFYVYDVNKTETATPLPFDNFFVEGGVQWTEHITFEFSPGQVTFVLKYDDQATNRPFFNEYNFMLKLW